MIDKLWSPSEKLKSNSNITRYIRYLKSNDIDINSYSELYDWSVKNREGFWESIWRFGDIIYSKKYNNILENGYDMLESKWFSGAKLNFAENLLRFKNDDISLISERENGKKETISNKELYDRVARLSDSLRKVGVGVGDRVAGFMPNIN